MRRGAAALLLMALALAACQSSAPPPAADADAGAVTYGDWTVKQGGYVRVESGIVK